MSFDYRLHVFRSPLFQSVVEEAITFFNTTPVHELPPPGSFVATGVYALYYTGSFDSYSRIASLNRKSKTQPIYVGKAVPPGWRAARSRETDTQVIYRRLHEHARSIQQATNLEVGDF